MREACYSMLYRLKGGISNTVQKVLHFLGLRDRFSLPSQIRMRLGVDPPV
jgi:hypothetical protein